MGKKGGRGGGGRKANVQHTGIGEAPFILKLREQYGLKSREEQRSDDVSAKFGDDDPQSRKARPEPDDPNLLDVKDDDQPEVVVLNKGDLTREEAEKAIVSGAEGVQGVLSAANKTQVAKRLTKDRENMQKTLHATTRKTASAKAKSEDDAGDNPTKKKKKTKSKRPKLSKALNKKNTGLLSFGDEED